mmetsp:Transcript_28685/g.65630  ORF Transcript_28685/g.65630 Transcript_28685/m.65630 type:complete len:289 (-) Transcript_28685:331-1197(-)
MDGHILADDRVRDLHSRADFDAREHDRPADHGPRADGAVAPDGRAFDDRLLADRGARADEDVAADARGLREAHVVLLVEERVRVLERRVAEQVHVRDEGVRPSVDHVRDHAPERVEGRDAPGVPVGDDVCVDLVREDLRIQHPRDEVVVEVLPIELVREEAEGLGGAHARVRVLKVIPRLDGRVGVEARDLHRRPLGRHRLVLHELPCLRRKKDRQIILVEEAAALLGRRRLEHHREDRVLILLLLAAVLVRGQRGRQLNVRHHVPAHEDKVPADLAARVHLPQRLAD